MKQLWKVYIEPDGVGLASEATGGAIVEDGISTSFCTVK